MRYPNESNQVTPQDLSCAPSTVRIAVLTYQRPQDIAQALPRLVEQAELVTGGHTSCDVLVVDNDPEGSAREFVTAFAAERPNVQVRYANETEPGISAARNRALAESADHDLLAFIDDDERPSERWLPLLLDTYREHACAAVVGPVVSEFEVEPDPWVSAGRFFDRRRLPSGSVVEVAATNNLLIDLHVIRGLGLSFDVRYGITGGGDTMFTRELDQSGKRLVWCDEAVVYDVVPASRLTRTWVVRRALRSGTSWSSTSLALATGSARRTLIRLDLTRRGTIRFLGGAARMVVGVATRSLSQHARGLRTLSRGAGMISGAWGYRYQEYKRS